MKKYIFQITVMILLSSCGIYNKYERPDDLDIKLTYRDVSMRDRESSTIATLFWRELFTDADLQALIEIGLSNNTEMRSAHLRVQEAEAILLSSKLSCLPALSLSPEGTLNSFDGAKSTKSYSLTGAASWEIDIFGKVTNAKREAKAELEGTKAYEQAVQTRLIATIADSYYTLLMLDRQLEINNATLESWETSVRTLEVLKRAGESDDSDILQARANCLALKSSIWKTMQSIHEMENSLSVLLGLHSQDIKRGVLSEQQFPETLSIGVPLQLLSNRPDVRQAEYELAKAFYVTNAARATFYPSLTLSGTVGWTNSMGNAITNPGSLLLSAVGALTQPLFNKGKNIANLKVAKAQQEEALLAFEQKLLNAGQEVNDAVTQWQMASERVTLDQLQIEALQEATRKTELLMKYSSVNYLQVLSVQQSLLSAELTQVQNRFEKIQGVINLYHALGGGI